MIYYLHRFIKLLENYLVRFLLTANFYGVYRFAHLPNSCRWKLHLLQRLMLLLLLLLSPVRVD
jgi:hypothetical protein